MIKIENVLSLFDGHSGCQIALKELGIIPKNYFASEIDKHAIKATMHNFPNTIQLGSVVDIDVSKLPKIDLLSGGSPCQSFSFAGKRKGMSTVCETEILTLEHYLQLKSEGYEFEGQSYLFWEYMRVLTELRKVNPDILFLLENVEMGKKWEGVLSKAIGINGLHINSALVSAQNRERIYWLNWHTKKDGLFSFEYPNIPQPKDRGIFLKDILESEVDEKYYLSEMALKYINRSITNQRFVQHEENEKGGCVTANYHKGIYDSEGIAPALCANKADLLILEQKENSNSRLIETLSKNELVENCLIDSYNQSIHTEKSITIGTRVIASNHTHVYKNSRIRRLTETECKRLQTIPEWFSFDGISSTQIYRQIGNGWTIEVIKHLLSFLP